jgi:hypothetical protein
VGFIRSIWIQFGCQGKGKGYKAPLRPSPPPPSTSRPQISHPLLSLRSGKKTTLHTRTPPASALRVCRRRRARHGAPSLSTLSAAVLASTHASTHASTAPPAHRPEGLMCSRL